MNEDKELPVAFHKKDEAKKLLKEMELMRKNVENSKFYAGMCSDLKDNEKIKTHLRRLQGIRKHVQVVIYGLGSIEFSFNSQFQLAVVLLLKRDFSTWIGDVEIYDPIMSTVDITVFKKLGLKVLTKDENCKRIAKVPTMFYMPSPCYYLLGNLLGANWSTTFINQIFLLTNSLNATSEVLPLYDQSTLETKIRLMRILDFIEEFPVNTSDHQMYGSLFQGFAWHFFNVDPKIRLSASGCDWEYMHRYLKLVILNDIKSNKTSEEFRQILGSNRGPYHIRCYPVAPQTGWIKLNIYGIGTEGDQIGRFGGVFRDQNGKRLDSYCYRGDIDVKDDVIAGLEALRFGLISCKEGKPKAEKLMVESYNAMLVQYVNGRPEPNEETQSILNEILDLLKGITCAVYHVYEEVNKVARDLVRRDECSNNGPNAASQRKLYVENIPINMAESEVKKLFEDVGPLESFHLPKDLKTGHRKGFGFVQFAQLEHAKQGRKYLRKIDRQDYILQVVPATDHVEIQDAGAKTTDFNDDGGGSQHDAKFNGTG